MQLRGAGAAGQVFRGRDGHGARVVVPAARCEVVVLKCFLEENGPSSTVGEIGARIHSATVDRGSSVRSRRAASVTGRVARRGSVGNVGVGAKHRVVAERASIGNGLELVVGGRSE